MDGTVLDSDCIILVSFEIGDWTRTAEMFNLFVRLWAEIQMAWLKVVESDDGLLE
jgi:hypothetical protein